MRFTDMMRICYSDLMNKKARTLLTVLGVLVGTCAIIVMISIGIAMEKSQTEMLASMGNLKQIKVHNYNSGRQKAITDQKLKEWAKLEGVDVVTPLYSFRTSEISIEGRGQKRRTYQMMPDIIGIDPEAFQKIGLTPVEGQIGFSGLPQEKGKRLKVVIGEEAAYQFMDPKKSWRDNRIEYETDGDGNPVKEPFVNMFEDHVIMKIKKGQSDKNMILELNTNGRIRSDYNIHYATGYGIFVDLYEFREILKKAGVYKKEDEQKGYEEILILLSDLKYADRVEKTLKDEGYEISSLTDMRKQMEEGRNKQLQMLYSMGVLALFVATISIMNTMIMSISERTKEIGVMKVLGCRISDIRKLFLIEAGTIGLLGGLTGVALSYGISFLLNRFGSSTIGQAFDSADYIQQGAVSIIPFHLAVFGLVVAVAVGVLAGFLPANRAVKISAREAMVNG